MYVFHRNIAHSIPQAISQSPTLSDYTFVDRSVLAARELTFDTKQILTEHFLNRTDVGRSALLVGNPSTKLIFRPSSYAGADIQGPRDVVPFLDVHHAILGVGVHIVAEDVAMYWPMHKSPGDVAAALRALKIMEDLPSINASLGRAAVNAAAADKNSAALLHQLTNGTFSAIRESAPEELTELLRRLGNRGFKSHPCALMNEASAHAQLNTGTESLRGASRAQLPIALDSITERLYSELENSLMYRFHCAHFPGAFRAIAVFVDPVVAGGKFLARNCAPDVVERSTRISHAVSKDRTCIDECVHGGIAPHPLGSFHVKNELEKIRNWTKDVHILGKKLCRVERMHGNPIEEFRTICRSIKELPVQLAKIASAADSLLAHSSIEWRAHNNEAVGALVLVRQLSASSSSRVLQTAQDFLGSYLE